MPHVFEPAPTGRAKCRGCGRAIAKGELRFGERLPNPFAEGEMTLWFHPLCAAYKRPEAVLQALAEAPPAGTDVAALERAAGGSSRTPSAHASAASCRSIRSPTRVACAARPSSCKAAPT